MVLNEPMDYRKDPDIVISSIYMKYYNNPDNKDEFMRSQNNINFMRQRRLFITPTIDFYQVAVEDESNRVIRQFKDFLSYFVRVSFVDEQLEKSYYHTENKNLLLGYIHHILMNGLSLGPYKLKFLSYSNSQIKNHCCWMLVTHCQNPGLNMITEEQIIASMGDFSKEKNLLKQYARRG